jgi:hypothetical protein
MDKRGGIPSSLPALLAASISRVVARFKAYKVSALGIWKLGGPMAPLGGAPRLVLLFSGKRKSGKDFLTEALQSRCRWGGEGGGKGALYVA